MAVISWTLLGLATGFLSELVHEGEFTRRRLVGVFALAAAGAARTEEA